MRVVASYMGVLDATLPTGHVSGRHGSPPRPRWRFSPTPMASTQGHPDTQTLDQPGTCSLGPPDVQTSDLSTGDAAQRELFGAGVGALGGEGGVGAGTRNGSVMSPVTHAKQFEALLSDSDSDLEEDLAAVHLAEHILEKKVSGDHALGFTSPTRRSADLAAEISHHGQHMLRHEGQEDAGQEAIPVGQGEGPHMQAGLHEGMAPDAVGVLQDPASTAADGAIDPANLPGETRRSKDGAGQEGLICEGTSSSSAPPQGGDSPLGGEDVSQRGAEPGVGVGGGVSPDSEGQPSKGPDGNCQGDVAAGKLCLECDGRGAVEGGTAVGETAESDQGMMQQDGAGALEGVGGSQGEGGIAVPETTESGQGITQRDGEGASEGAGELRGEGGADNGQPTEGGSAPVRRSGSSRLPPSAKALGATWELLEGCLFRMPADLSSLPGMKMSGLHERLGHAICVRMCVFRVSEPQCYHHGKKFLVIWPVHGTVTITRSIESPLPWEENVLGAPDVESSFFDRSYIHFHTAKVLKIM
jgi:hypothetical protein